MAAFRFVFVLAIFFCYSNFLKAEEKMRIAILDLKPDGVTEQDARTISNMIRNEFINMEDFIVVERNQMDEILNEQGLQQTGCTDQACAVELGKLISARKMLVGEVMPLGEAFVITVRIVDIEKGVSEFAAKDKAEAKDLLYQTAERISQKLAWEIKGGDPEDFSMEGSERTATGYYLRGFFIPGWGQIYAERNIKGTIFLGSFLVSGLVLGGTFYNYTNKKKEYDDLEATASESEFDSKYDDYEKASKINKGAIALVGLVYVINWIDLIFITDYKSSSSLAHSDSNIFYDFNYYRSVNSGVAEKKIDFCYGIKF